MLQTIGLIIITLIGVFNFPIFTLGSVLIHYNHPILGIVVIIYSLFKDGRKDDEVDYTD